MKKILLLLIPALLFSSAHAEPNTPAINKLTRLKLAYPKQINNVTETYIIWSDGSKMPLSIKGTLLNQLNNGTYPIVDKAHFVDFRPTGDPGRIRDEPFFMKMYGYSQNDVRKNLVTVYWMSKIFDRKYPLQVTRVNNVDKKFVKISRKLESLVRRHPEYKKFLENPGGTFIWRNIKHSPNISAHSFGIAIDINTQHSDYWQWDLKKKKLPINESQKLDYHNKIPWEIVHTFEKYGFIWGGKWYHYDTMHFEYRPEMFDKRR